MIFEKQIKVNNKLLANNFVNNKNLQMIKVTDELKKRGFETNDDCSWLIDLALRLSGKEGLDFLHNKKTPVTLMKKFGLPEILNALEVRTIIESNESLKNIFYLSMAIFSLHTASGCLDKKDYDGFVSLTLMSVETFATYETLNLNDQRKSLTAKINAYKSHAETYELKNQAIEYWQSHIDPKLSNPKAADMLLKVVKVSHRKLVEYVAEAKRKSLPPASIE